MQFIVDHDLLTTFDPGGVARTGKIRFHATVWHDGFSLDMIVQAVDDEGNAILDSSISGTRSTGGHFRVEYAQELRGESRVFLCPDWHQDRDHPARGKSPGPAARVRP